MTKEETATTVSWIAIVLAIASLVLSMFAYNRTGSDLSSQLREETQEIETDARILTARAEAGVRLATIQTRLETEKLEDGIADEIATIRADLNESYSNASMETQQEMAELDTEFETLEREIRENSADALSTLQGLLDNLEKDVRYDN